MKKRQNLYKYLLALIVIAFFVLRLPQVIRNEFPFVFDMGRDHIWVRNMVELKKPTLIGPWGSLAGVYFGPAWYYLLAIPYIISGGVPSASVIWVMLLNLIALLIGFKFLKKTISLKSALIFAAVFALSPLNISIAAYPFHANILPLTQIIFLVTLFNKNYWLAALISSLNFHFEPATGIFTTLTLIAFMIWKRKEIRIKSIRNSIIAFIIPFIPQVIFELRHGFIQTKSLLLYFQGQNQSLEGYLPLFTRIGERIRKFTGIFSSSVFPYKDLLLVGLMFTLVVIYLLIIKKTKKEITLLNITILTLIIPLLGFMFIFPPELKTWYLYGFSINYFIFIALFIDKIHFSRTIYFILLIFFYLAWLGQLNNRLTEINKKQAMGPEFLKSQIQAIDTVYALSDNKPFSAYVYTPPIYDYQYQYLFWLNHKQKKLPLPVEYSYLPNETNYHPQKQYFSNSSWSHSEIIFLIMEPENNPERINGWLGHFANYPLLDTQILPSGITIQTRKKPI